MRDFRNILYVSRGLADEVHALTQAVLIAHNNKAKLTIALLYPTLPRRMADYQQSFQQGLLVIVQTMLEAAGDALGYTHKQIHAFVTIEYASTNMRKTWILEHVLSDDYDLVVKQAEISEKDKSLKSIDMGLMRKCPCPIWLYHPPKHTYKIKQVVIAVDPDTKDLVDNNFVINLLKLGDYIATTMQAKLIIVACWDSPGFQGIPPKQVAEILNGEKERYMQLLKDAIHKAAVTKKFHLELINGNASKILPVYIEENNIDLLVMGTVARTGLPGLILGNTAEHVLQKVRCSLAVLKPRWFMSPIKDF